MPRSPHACALLLGALLLCQPGMAADIIVSQTENDGPGSLFEAIHLANRQPGADTIRFDPVVFATPQTLVLKQPLPSITDTLTIDGYIPDRLWKSSGVTLDGQSRFPLFTVPGNTHLTLRYLTLTGGKNRRGGALFSQGHVLLDSLLIMNNRAEQGGAIYQQAGQLTLLNSTLLNNQAQQQGGGIFSEQGSLTLIHNTLTANTAPAGAGLFRQGSVTLANNILAHNQPGPDAECRPASFPSTQNMPGDNTSNLIMSSSGCGTPRFTTDPLLGELGYYNGPTRSLPLRGNSPVINQADNALSVDAAGNPLMWDQRGNGDPRFAAGIADLGAFEKQAVLQLQVDTLSDEDLRRCTRLSQDCSLRGAIALLNADPQQHSLTLDPKKLPGASTITLDRPLPALKRDITLQLQPGQSLEVRGHGGVAIKQENGNQLILRSVQP